jgi:pyruvate/2-oxoglutarate dehydrogenase complex dihydrolipoamide dehydrogenase (E3) component
MTAQADSYDVIVIGAGPAGEALSGILADAGKRVAICEEHLVGGECSYYACMPSKALLRPDELLHEIDRVPGVERDDGLRVQAVLDRRDEVIHDLDDGAQLPWLEDRGIALLRGHARLTGERRVELGDDAYEAAEAVVIATGSVANVPPIPGLREAEPWTNRELTTAKEVPARLVVIGGGVVGTEMADAWNSLGSEVVLLENGDRILAKVEPFASEQVAAALRERGVEIHTGVKATEASRDGDGTTVTLEDGATHTGDRVLVAIGRRPPTDDIGLDAVGLEPGKTIDVDDGMRSPAVPWLYAVGDVNGRALLTHMGKYQARICAARILGDPDAKVKVGGAQSPQVVFTDPQVAAVGLTLAGAEEQGIVTKAIDLPTEGTAGGSFYGRGADGTTRFVVDTEKDILVGATFVGPDVTDMLQAATIAVAGEVPLATLRHAVAPFPTRSELWLNFLNVYG